MRIAVMGAGGVGGYFGARLAAAGHDVSFVARGDHLAALRARGLVVRSANGDVAIAAPRASDDPATLGAADVVLFAVKLWDTEGAAARLRPLLAHGGLVVTLQNGVESIDRVGAVVGAGRVTGGAAYLAATIAEPGVIVHTGTLARLRFGPVLPGQQAAVDSLLAACRDAGVDSETVPDVRLALWEKFVFLVALSGLTAISGQPLGVVRSDPELRAQFEAAMVEAWSLGRACGVALADEFVAAQMRFADTLPHGMRSSMLNDLVAGRRLEAPWLCGAVERMAKPLRVATPINNAIHAALKPYCDGRPVAQPKETS
jgi:2-dehydropantoate 2-reductase